MASGANPKCVFRTVNGSVNSQSILERSDLLPGIHVLEGGTAQLLCEKLGKAIARENNYIIPPAESANGKNCQITKLPNCQIAKPVNVPRKSPAWRVGGSVRLGRPGVVGLEAAVQ